MRILIVHELADFLGGAEGNVYQVGQEFGKRGHSVDLLYDRRGEDDKFLEDFENSWQFRDFDAAIAKRPDAIYVHKTSDHKILQKLIDCGIPLVRMVHDHDIYCQRSSRYFPWNRNICTKKTSYACAVTCTLVRNKEGKLPFKLAWPSTKLKEIELCKQFHTHIVPTEFMKSQLVLNGFDPDRIHPVPVAPQRNRTIEGNNYDTPNILFVGQLIRGKGVDFLLRSLAELREMNLEVDWRCTIAGVGSHMEACEALNEKLQLTDRVTFTGLLNREELDEEYRKARLAVVTSVWPEPLPTVGLEFMWAALPVVGFDAGGISHWLEDGKSGLLVEPKDTTGLAKTMAKLLEDKGLAEKMGLYALQRAEELYRHDQYIDHLLEILADPAAVEAPSGEAVPVARLEPSTTTS